MTYRGGLYDLYAAAYLQFVPLQARQCWDEAGLGQEYVTEQSRRIFAVDTNGHGYHLRLSANPDRVQLMYVFDVHRGGPVSGEKPQNREAVREAGSALLQPPCNIGLQPIQELPVQSPGSNQQGRS